MVRRAISSSVKVSSVRRSEGGPARSRAAEEALVPPFRFSRMGPSGSGHQLPEANRRRLGEAIVVGGGGDSQIPAGFTYLGQFVDHDLTFDKTSVMLGEDVSPAELLQARSPSLDLDSLYGAGPADPASEKFYEADGVHLKMGKTLAAEGLPGMEGFDLPRGAGTTAAAKRKAIIPDPRNDENLAVAQTHLAMIRFHNRVVDTLPGLRAPGPPFREGASEGHEALPVDAPHRLPPADLRGGRREQRVQQREEGVRGRRAGDRCPDDADRVLRGRLPARSLHDPQGVRLEQHLRQRLRHARLPLHVLRRQRHTRRRFAPSEQLDRGLPAPLRLQRGRPSGPRRPGGASSTERCGSTRRSRTRWRASPGFPAAEDNLAFRNLTRAHMVKLATGQQMATFLKNKGVNLTKLTTAQIRDGLNGATLEGLTQVQRTALLSDTPLWFYILREAELNQGRLKGVGARIVAETFHRAIEGSRISIVRDPALAPDARTRQHHVPDGRPALVRVRGEEEPAGSGGVTDRRAHTGPTRPGGRRRSRAAG